LAPKTFNGFDFADAEESFGQSTRQETAAYNTI
jgi:hypothetical protein